MAISVDQAMRSNGKRIRKKEQNVWNEHDVDQGFWNGKRHATRGAAPTMPHHGAAVEFFGNTAVEFLEGVGLYVQADQPDWWRVTCMITGDTLGYAPVHSAMGYRKAAAMVGVSLDIYRQ